MRNTSHPIGRREFLMGAAGSLLVAGSAPVLGQNRAATWRPDRKVLFISVDGFGPDYLHQSDMPNLKRMIAAGAYVEGEGVIPSVTNVNNASILTASFPRDHGITGNYYYDRAKGSGTFMESPAFLLRPTILQEAGSRGLKTGFVTSKEKLMFLSQGADFAVSAQSPNADFAAAVGPPQDVYSPDINYWSFRAARHLLRERACQLVYLATTDYMMHTYAPADERSQTHLHMLDELLGQIVNDHARLEVYLTADHGMSAKRDAIDIGRVMAENDIPGEAVPVIRDRYVVHHGNLGGACYVYLENERDLERAFALLGEIPGVEELHRKEEAADRFQLRADRIGDIFMLGARQAVFGSLKATREDVVVRSHGSRHEAKVPILCYGRHVDASLYRRNIDLTRNFAWET